MRGWSLALVVGLLSTVASPARAGDGADKAAATELFNAGRDLMKGGDYAAACPKLAESARLEPTVGALAKLAECEEHERRLVSAYGRWQQALNLARATGDERAADVEREVARLDAVVPKLKIVAGGALPTDTVIRLDAVELGPAGLGVALAVEPGTHAVQAAAAGKRTWGTSVETRADGRTTGVTVPVLEDLAPAPAPAPAPASAPAPAPASAPALWGSAGLVATGVGVATLAVATGFGFAAIAQRNEAGCAGNVCPDEGHATTLRGAQTSATVSTALFIVGGALVGGGLAVWWFAGGPGRTTGVLVTPVGAIGTF